MMGVMRRIQMDVEFLVLPHNEWACQCAFSSLGMFGNIL